MSLMSPDLPIIIDYGFDHLTTVQHCLTPTIQSETGILSNCTLVKWHRAAYQNYKFKLYANLFCR